MIEKADFFNRICIAFGISPGRGAKAVIAREVDLSETAVGKWEKGEIPGIENLEKIAISTGSSLHWLLTGQGPQTIDELKAAEEQILDRINLEKFVRRIAREELRHINGAPSFGLDLTTTEEKKAG